MQSRPTFDDATDRVVRALALFGIMPGMAVSVVAAVLAGPLFGLLALVVVAGGWAVLVVYRVRSCYDRVLGSVGAAKVAAGGHPRWENVVDGLCATSGVADPDLWILDRPEANALVVADRDRLALVVTGGLLDLLGAVELEAVVANLLGRAKDGSARYGTVMAGMLGPFLGRDGAAGRLLADGLGDQRAVRSDLAAVDLTRYPPGLSSALARMEDLGTTVTGADPATAHLWVAPVVAADGGVDGAVAETALQPLSLRRAVLDEL